MKESTNTYIELQFALENWFLKKFNWKIPQSYIWNDGSQHSWHIIHVYGQTLTFLWIDILFEFTWVLIQANVQWGCKLKSNTHKEFFDFPIDVPNEIWEWDIFLSVQKFDFCIWPLLSYSCVAVCKFLASRGMHPLKKHPVTIWWPFMSSSSNEKGRGLAKPRGLWGHRPLVCGLFCVGAEVEGGETGRFSKAPQ